MKLHRSLSSTLLILFLIGSISIAQTTATPSPAAAPSTLETKEQQDARMAWWHEAMFGMFIH